MADAVNVKRKITLYLQEAVTALQQETIDKDEAVGSRDTTNAVCHAIEAALLHGLKGSSADKNFWGLLKKFMHKSTRSQISELKQISTDVGRCRAWIRVTMNECALESYLRLIVAADSTLKHYYRQSAFIRDIEQPGIMLTYIQGISELTFNLSTNSTVLNQWTSTTLALSGLLAKSDILHAVVSPTAGHSPRVARPVSVHHAVISHNTQTALQPPLSVPANMSLSTSCPQRLDSRFLDSSLDSLQLTQMEIDAIRNLGRPGRGSGASSPSTPTSQLSHPDFVDPRPDIYRFVYDISPGSRSRVSDSASASAEGGDSQASELPQESKFDEIVIASMEHSSNRLVAQRQKAKAVTSREGEDTNETFLKTAAQHLQSDSLPSFTESTTGLHATSKPETQEAVMSPAATIHNSEVVVSVGDALVALQQSSELTASESSSGIQQLPVTTAADAGLSKLREPASSRIHKESFGSLLKNYNASAFATPMKIPTVEQIIQTLPPTITDHGSTTVTSHTNPSTSSDDIMGLTTGTPDDLQRGSEPKSNQLDNLLRFGNEKGLSHQCYQCRGCTRPIGMFYGKERLCAFDGYYYCYECHENSEHYIPAYVVFNWDFRPYQVCKKSFDFLVGVNNEPLIDVEQVNEHLYEHVAALHEVMLLRTQLHSLQAYLFSCKQPVAEELLSKVSGKSYLLDSIHVYSLRDLTQVAAGTFAHRLKKAVDYGANHVYSCILCSQKGFICELCHHSKVIYPFELTTTSQCETCKAVYHASCKTKLVPCPRCARRHSSSMCHRLDPIEHISYSFPADNLTAS